MCLFGGLQSVVKSIKYVSKWRDRREEMELIPGGDFEWWFWTSVKTNFECLQERVWDRASPTLRTVISDVQFHMTEGVFFEDERIKWRTDGCFLKTENREEMAARDERQHGEEDFESSSVTTMWRWRFWILGRKEEEDAKFGNMKKKISWANN